MIWILWAVLIIALIAGIVLLIRRYVHLGTILTIGAFALIIVTGGIQLVDFNSGDGAAATINKTPTTSESPTPSATPSASGTPTGQPCPAGYAQEFDQNKAQRFYSGGVKTSKKDLEYLGHDARTLAFRAFALKFVDTPAFGKLLEPGAKCLSREGQDLYQQVKGALSGTGVKVDNNGVAPADGYNTGMVNGRAVVDSDSGVRGDRSAIVYTLRDGSKMYVMHRCGNLVFKSPPKGVPTGPTDNPKPPKPPRTTPPPSVHKCPPSMPHGTWPVCKDDYTKGPAHNPQFPEQQKPNPLPAKPEHHQATKPADPPSVYTPPPAAPKPTPTPRPTPPPPPATGAPGHDEAPSTCAPPPGKTTCP